MKFGLYLAIFLVCFHLGAISQEGYDEDEVEEIMEELKIDSRPYIRRPFKENNEHQYFYFTFAGSFANHEYSTTNDTASGDTASVTWGFGYSFNKYVSADFMSMRLGSFSDFNPVTTSNDEFDMTLNNLGVMLKLPMGYFEPYLKGGISVTSSTYKFKTALVSRSASETGTAPFLAPGFQYGIARGYVDLFMEYHISSQEISFFGADYDWDYSMLVMGFKINF